MIKAIIFDLDGTLLNTLDDLTDSTNFALAAFGFPQRSIAEIRRFVGNGVKRLMQLAVPDGEANPQFQSCFDTFKKHYEANMYNKTAPYPGILDLLANLHAQNYKMAIVSNKFDAAVKELNVKYFKGYIEAAAGEAPHIHRKPAPDMVFSVLKELGVNKEEAVYIGDSEVDFKTAQNAGLPCISVTWGFRDKVDLIALGAKNFAAKPGDIEVLLQGEL